MRYSPITANNTRTSTMTPSLKQVIEALLAQGFNKAQVLDTLANEYWIDSSVTRFLSTI